MTSGYKNSSGTDLDSIFAARGSLTARANVGIKVGTQDLADRYAKVADGAAADANTGYKISDGTDLRYVFAKTGSLVFEFHLVSGTYNSQVDINGDISNNGYNNQPSVVYYIDAGANVNRGITTGSMPGSVTSLTIINNGVISGSWGTGGNGGVFGVGSNGGAGGAAINVTINCSITNNDTIRGGGGGGGGGAGCSGNGEGHTDSVGGAGGSGQWGGGAAGGGTNGQYGGSQNYGYGLGGTAPGGNGGAGYVGAEPNIIAGGGGAGGSFASAGGNGGSAFDENFNSVAGGSGGAAGKAIEYNGHTVSLTNNGTLLGATS